MLGVPPHPRPTIGGCMSEAQRGCRGWERSRNSFFFQEIKAEAVLGTVLYRAGCFRERPEQGKESAGRGFSLRRVPGSRPRGSPGTAAAREPPPFSQPCAGDVTGISETNEQLRLSPGEPQPGCGRGHIPSLRPPVRLARPGQREHPCVGRSTPSTPTALGQRFRAWSCFWSVPRPHQRCSRRRTGRSPPVCAVLDFPGASRRVCNPPSPGWHQINHS